MNRFFKFYLQIPFIYYYHINLSKIYNLKTELNNTATILSNYNSILTEISTQALVITSQAKVTYTKIYQIQH